jgi:hypothetical protein
MAGLKKSKRQKDTSSPNIVLVLFLILFILSNIILGLWLYFTYDEKNKALAAKTIADKEKAANQNAIAAYKVVLDELRMAVGQQLNQDEKTILETNRKNFYDDTGAYAKIDDVAKSRPNYIKLIGELKADLGYDEGTGEYKATYQAKYKDEADKATKAEASLKATQKQRDDAQTKFKELAEKQDTDFAAMTAKFAKEQQTVLKDVNKQTDTMGELIKVNQQLNQQIAEDQQKYQKAEGKLRKEIAELKATIRGFEEKTTEGAGALARDSREPHALLLDISMGKPLWDDPVGQVTRVDVKAKEVTINLGSAKGVRPDMTFNVFGPSKYAAQRAEKQLKGTIEVQRVLGPNTSIAKITAMFDPEFPMHEGDLLFNVFWGTHVAITGYVNVTGVASDSPGEQMRQLADFMYLLERQGVIIDAYLDLTDGQVKGAITSSTRFLIRGDDLRLDAKDVEDKSPRAERAVAVNNATALMRKEAVEKGLFVISAKNFAAVIGYRPPAALTQGQPGFRPQLPTAGSVIPTVGAPTPRPDAPMPPMEKKDEKMDKDKGG